MNCEIDHDGTLTISPETNVDFLVLRLIYQAKGQGPSIRVRMPTGHSTLLHTINLTWTEDSE